MVAPRARSAVLGLGLALSAAAASCAQTAHPPLFLPEALRVRVRDPSELPHVPIPDIPRPPTVTDPQSDLPERKLSLNGAIRIALQNAEVVRVLSGVTASSSGRTIYDTASTQTNIDQQQAAFDPTAHADNTFTHVENGQAAIDPLDPTNAVIGASRTGGYNLDTGVTKRTLSGATANLNVNSNTLRFGSRGLPLNPQTQSALEMSVVQPLLQGRGRAANAAPIVLARIDTERSYFRLKDSVQLLVRGVIEGYWALVFARTDLWARRRQAETLEQSFTQAQAKYESGLADLQNVSQTSVALANVRASLITAEANVLQREAALRNIMGLPPGAPDHLVPTTPPQSVNLRFQWEQLLQLAEENRPDVIEWKLILEADQQQIILANNAALPSVNAVMLYRWNGLQGTTPARHTVSSPPGSLTNWTLGVNFSVPVGLRGPRAQLRQRQLLLASDRAQLMQSLHNSAHLLALALRNLEQNYQQYLAYQETRKAARINLELQLAKYNAGLGIFLNVLQAITDWGNAVSAEAQALTQYNVTLAEVEQYTGTILETHGVRFYEERSENIGPLGRWHAGRLYPSSVFPGNNADRYRQGEQPSEEFFDLRDPLERRESAPLPEPLPPTTAPTRLPPTGG